RLRQNPRTAHIPVIFMTARVRAQELEHFKSLGASGAIAKPFSAKNLRQTLRSHLPVAGDTGPAAPDEIPAADLTSERRAFQNRLQADSIELERLWVTIQGNPISPAALEELQNFAHKLAGSACFFGFEEIGRIASALEASIVRRISGD